MRAIIFANGELTHHKEILKSIHPGDLIIAANGGIKHCLNLDIVPKVIIGDLDSINGEAWEFIQEEGVKINRHPSKKDNTDLELALLYVLSMEIEEIILYGALGSRWDMTLANLLLPANSKFRHTRIRIIDGNQEIFSVKSGETIELHGKPGDTLSLIPLNQDACGITTHGLEYSLIEGSLEFGSTRGISNVFLDKRVKVSLQEGQLLCILIHEDN